MHLFEDHELEAIYQSWGAKTLCAHSPDIREIFMGGFSEAVKICGSDYKKFQAETGFCKVAYERTVRRKNRCNS